MTKPKRSALQRHIESLQGDRPWGAVLDAGTGANSMRWITSLKTTRWTAVTASPDYAAWVRGAVGAAERPQDKILVGDWADPEFLQGEVFDTIFAGYLLGAIEGFAPYFQSYLFARLRPLTGRALYVTGLEPYVPAPRPEGEAGRLVWEIGRFRDACLLLAGDRPYREYPSAWVVDELRRAGFAVRHAKRFPLRYKARFVNAQIDLCAPLLKSLADRALAEALARRGEALRAEALAMIDTEGALKTGHDYVIAAEPV